MRHPFLKSLAVRSTFAVMTLVATALTLIQCGFHEIAKIGAPMMRVQGPQVKETRSSGPFSRIEAGDAFEVQVKLGNHPSIEIEAPKDLLPFLKSRVDNGTLILESDVSYSMTGNQHVRAVITTPTLEGASVSGACKMSIVGKVASNAFEADLSGSSSLDLSATVDDFILNTSGSSIARVNLKTKSLQVGLSGSSSCTIQGAADSSKIEVSGSSTLDGPFTSRNADVTADGASHVKLKVNDTLTGEASGASEILYGGNPTRVNRDASGVSRIEPMN